AETFGGGGLAHPLPRAKKLERRFEGAQVAIGQRIERLALLGGVFAPGIEAGVGIDGCEEHVQGRVELVARGQEQGFDHHDKRIRLSRARKSAWAGSRRAGSSTTASMRSSQRAKKSVVIRCEVSKGGASLNTSTSISPPRRSGSTREPNNQISPSTSSRACASATASSSSRRTRPDAHKASMRACSGVHASAG